MRWRDREITGLLLFDPIHGNKYSIVKTTTFTCCRYYWLNSQSHIYINGLSPDSLWVFVFLRVTGGMCIVQPLPATGKLCGLRYLFLFYDPTLLPHLRSESAWQSKAEYEALFMNIIAPKSIETHRKHMTRCLHEKEGPERSKRLEDRLWSAYYSSNLQVDGQGEFNSSCGNI